MSQQQSFNQTQQQEMPAELRQFIQVQQQLHVLQDPLNNERISSSTIKDQQTQTQLPLHNQIGELPSPNIPNSQNPLENKTRCQQISEYMDRRKQHHHHRHEHEQGHEHGYWRGHRHGNYSQQQIDNINQNNNNNNNNNNNQNQQFDVNNFKNRSDFQNFKNYITNKQMSDDQSQQASKFSQENNGNRRWCRFYDHNNSNQDYHNQISSNNGSHSCFFQNTWNHSENDSCQRSAHHLPFIFMTGLALFVGIKFTRRAFCYLKYRECARPQNCSFWNRRN